tara:strand:+ start:345 stop:488 length:144 start_codon:yes stop_codon:yes gene_type:complete
MYAWKSLMRGLIDAGAIRKNSYPILTMIAAVESELSGQLRTRAVRGV